MDKFKFIKGLYTEEVVVNKPNTELAVDINGNVITAGQKNDKDFQDQILNGVKDNSAPLKIYTVTGEMLKPVASLSPNRQTLTLDRLICRDSSREGNTLPAKVKTSFENINNYGNPTLKFSGTKTWNVDGNTKTLCELQLNNGVPYNKNAVLKASGHLTQHTFNLVGDGTASGTFHPGVTLTTSEISSGAFKDGKHYDNAKTYNIKTLEESSVWEIIKRGDAWKCKNSSGSVLYAVSDANEISTNDFTLESDLTTKIKNRETFTVRKYAYTTTVEKSIIISNGGYAYVNLNGCSLEEANEILKKKYGDAYEVQYKESEGYVVYNGGYPTLYGGRGALIEQYKDDGPITLSKTYPLNPPVYKFSESATIVLDKSLVYAKKEDKSIISAPSGSKILADGELTSNVEGKTSDIVYDGDVQLIKGSVYKGSTDDETIYYSMSDSVVAITDENYAFTGDEGHEINADKILYEMEDITYSVDFVD